jgi:hypothetical protein
VSLLPSHLHAVHPSLPHCPYSGDASERNRRDKKVGREQSKENRRFSLISKNNWATNSFYLSFSSEHGQRRGIEVDTFPRKRYKGGRNFTNQPLVLHL